MDDRYQSAIDNRSPQQASCLLSVVCEEGSVLGSGCVGMEVLRCRRGVTRILVTRRPATSGDGRTVLCLNR